MPGFVEIAQSLQGVNPPWEVTGVPPELAEEQDPIWMVGSIMFFTSLFQDVVSGAMYIDMLTCSMSLVCMGFIPSAFDCSVPTSHGRGGH